jgi:Beta-propeller repeat
MFRNRLVSVLAPALALCLCPTIAGSEELGKAGGAAAGKPAVESSWSRLPLRFEANQGQFEDHVLFVSRGPGFNLSLTREGASLLFAPPRSGGPGAAAAPRSLAVDLRLAGGSSAAPVTGESPVAAQAHYLTGRDQSRWRPNVPMYQSVRYDAVYPGIDLVFHGRNGRLEYDFIVAPGADPGQIGLDVRGADRLSVDAEGALVMSAGGLSLVQPRPVIYQEGPLGRTEVAGGYTIRENRVAFTLAAYDRSRPLVIDPVFTFASYLGGTDVEEVLGVARDAAGNVWFAGVTASPNIPVASALDGTYGGAGDSFVGKFDKQGDLLSLTYLGGSAFEQAWGLTLDRAGNVYVVGDTKSPDFPIVGGVQAQLSGDRDAYLVKLDPTGTRILYSTYLGGNQTDFGYAVDVDARGAIYLAGETESANFPIKNGAQPTYKGGVDGFVTKLAANGSAILYSTFIGGANLDRVWGIRVDAKNRAYLSGQTASPNFPRVKAFQNTYGGGRSDAFMAALSATGRGFLYSTFIGGAATDQGFGVAVDAAGNARSTGSAGNATFPIRRALQPTFGGGSSDAFIVGLSTNGSLQYSTFIGGGLADAAYAIDMDGRLDVYITGQTQSSNFPVRNALQGTAGGLRDGFLTKVRADGSAYVYSTYFGGANVDEGAGIDVDTNGVVYLAGWSDGGFPLVQPAQGNYAGGRDGLIASMGDTAAISLSCAAAARQLPPGNGGLIDIGLTARVENGGGPIDLQVFGDDGATWRDVESPETGRFLLRAESSSAGRDRVYLIVASAADKAGNRGAATCSVVVPRSESAEDVASAFARAAAVENHFERQRALPAGFSRLDRTGTEGSH